MRVRRLQLSPQEVVHKDRTVPQFLAITGIGEFEFGIITPGELPDDLSGTIEFQSTSLCAAGQGGVAVVQSQKILSPRVTTWKIAPGNCTRSCRVITKPSLENRGSKSPHSVTRAKAKNLDRAPRSVPTTNEVVAHGGSSSRQFPTFGEAIPKPFRNASDGCALLLDTPNICEESL